MDAGHDRVHQHRGRFGAETARREGRHGLAGRTAAADEWFGQEPQPAAPAQQAGGEQRKRIGPETVELAAGEDEPPGRPHVRGLHLSGQPIGGEQRGVFRPFELQGVRAGLDEPAVFPDRPDRAADAPCRLDDARRGAPPGQGVGDGQAGRAGPEDDGVEQHAGTLT